MFRRRGHLCVRLDLREHTHIYIYIYICICYLYYTYVCVYIYIYIYIHLHIKLGGGAISVYVLPFCRFGVTLVLFCAVLAVLPF